MYVIEIENDGVTELLHEIGASSTRRVKSCQFVEDLYAVPTATITVHPLDPGYPHLHEHTTLVRIINTLTGEAEFDGHVLQIPGNDMDSSGRFEKTVLCEGAMGYLQDTMQTKRRLVDTDVRDLLAALLDVHNAQMKDCPERQILLGQVTVHSIETWETEYRSTLDEIKADLTSRHGGILHLRRDTDGHLVLDYLREEDYGRASTTKVALGTDLKSITHSMDMTGVISRLYPYGAVIDQDTGERLTIASVNDGVTYLEDADALAKWGPKYGVLLLDDVTSPTELKHLAASHLASCIRAKHTYEATVLDLSVNGEAAEGFRAGMLYRFECAAVELEGYLRLTHRTVDIYDVEHPKIRIGDRLERITDIATQARNYISYEAPKQRSELLQQAKDNATELILAATTGYVIIRPNEILIMDTDSTATATKVWRLNAGGIGYSHSDVPGEAYDGEYGIAMTMDGAIVADFISAGYMYADRIRGGTLVLGGAGGQNGVMQVLDDNGTEICRFDKNGASIFGSIYSRNSSGYWVRIADGSLTGGRNDDVYTTVNATAVITDAESHIDYHGIYIHGDAIYLDCALFAVNGGTGVTGGASYVSDADLSYEPVEVVTDCWIDSSGELQKTTRYVSAITNWQTVTTTIFFTNGLMVSGLS